VEAPFCRSANRWPPPARHASNHNARPPAKPVGSPGPTNPQFFIS